MGEYSSHVHRTIHSPLTHPHYAGPLQWARNCALKRSVAAHLRQSGAYHPLSPVINLGICHPSLRKTRKKVCVECYVLDSFMHYREK